MSIARYTMNLFLQLLPVDLLSVDLFGSSIFFLFFHHSHLTNESNTVNAIRCFLLQQQQKKVQSFQTMFVSFSLSLNSSMNWNKTFRMCSICNNSRTFFATRIYKDFEGRGKLWRIHSFRYHSVIILNKICNKKCFPSTHKKYV